MVSGGSGTCVEGGESGLVAGRCRGGRVWGVVWKVRRGWFLIISDLALQMVGLIASRR